MLPTPNPKNEAKSLKVGTYSPLLAEVVKKNSKQTLNSTAGDIGLGDACLSTLSIGGMGDGDIV